MMFRRTLTRRVVIALLGALAVIWLVLIGFQYVEVRLQEDANPALEVAATQIGDILAVVADAAQARAIVAALDRSIAKARERSHVPGATLMQLVDSRDQRLVFSSSGAGNIRLLGIPGRQTKQTLGGRTYELMRVDTPRWSLMVAAPRAESTWLLTALSDDLTKYMLIALPFLLFPIWFAVSRGLRPLRQLSERLRARSPEDLRPVGIEPKYAELEPLMNALDNLLAQLSRKINGEQAFVASAAHELRTPLAVISAQAHVLAKADSPHERAEAEQPMLSAIARASHLVHQLLVLARLETEHRPEAITVDLAQLARQEIGHFVPAALARDIEIALEAPEELNAPLEVHACQSILQNLIDNAVRYGRNSGRILVELSPINLGREMLLLAVSDDGPGIAAADQSRVFDRFYRGSQRDTRGAGLGLTIVKQAAARLGGVVQIAAGLEGRGCRFEVHLPVMRRPSQGR